MSLTLSYQFSRESSEWDGGGETTTWGESPKRYESRLQSSWNTRWWFEGQMFWSASGSEYFFWERIIWIILSRFYLSSFWWCTILCHRSKWAPLFDWHGISADSDRLMDSLLRKRRMTTWLGNKSPTHEPSFSFYLSFMCHNLVMTGDEEDVINCGRMRAISPFHSGRNRTFDRIKKDDEETWSHITDWSRLEIFLVVFPSIHSFIISFHDHHSGAAESRSSFWSVSFHVAVPIWCRSALKYHLSRVLILLPCNWCLELQASLLIYDSKTKNVESVTLTRVSSPIIVVIIRIRPSIHYSQL